MQQRTLRTKQSAKLVEIQCPAEINLTNFKPSVFLAGGIGLGLTNVPLWQKTLTKKLLSNVDIVAMNPRRDSFPENDPNALKEQINWEHAALKVSDSILFWLIGNFSCPITNYELGFWSMRAKPIFVGIDPDYPNRNALVEQLKTTRPNLVIVDNLKELADKVKNWRNGVGPIDIPEARPRYRAKTVYLSGGISGCPDWQHRISKLLEKSNLSTINPRDNNLVYSKLSDKNSQILARRNHQKLLRSESFCFWFPEESQSPAPLFELGALASMTERPLFVGVHPKYFRVKDVIVQTGLVRPEVRVVHSLKDLANQISRYYKMR